MHGKQQVYLRLPWMANNTGKLGAHARVAHASLVVKQGIFEGGAAVTGNEPKNSSYTLVTCCMMGGAS